jgi:hypothetical protein
MESLAPIRFTSLASLFLASSMLAQLPPHLVKPSAAQATAPTLPAFQPTAAPPPTAAQLPPKHAQVTYTNGDLSISADNASLNQILRQIEHETGIKITGGVADERVFGQYGPAQPSQILAQLLDGTGSNMVIEHRDPTIPAELILTPRHGGPTPPSPNAAAFDDRPEPREVAPVQPGPREEDSQRSFPAPAATTVAPGSDISPTNSSEPGSPNGVKTPQQIYEQLQRMRQQLPQSSTPQ